MSKIFLFVVVSMAGSLTFAASEAYAAAVDYDVTQAVDGKATGGEKMETVTITPDEHPFQNLSQTSVHHPAEGKVYEGWLVDPGGSDYKLSLGEFQQNGTLQFTETMVNPYTYGQFIVTEEPFEDTDPNAACAGGQKFNHHLGQ